MEEPKSVTIDNLNTYHVHVMDILNGKIISNAAWKGLVNSVIMEREMFHVIY